MEVAVAVVGNVSCSTIVRDVFMGKIADDTFEGVVDIAIVFLSIKEYIKQKVDALSSD